MARTHAPARTLERRTPTRSGVVPAFLASSRITAETKAASRNGSNTSASPRRYWPRCHWR